MSRPRLVTVIVLVAACQMSGEPAHVAAPTDTASGEVAFTMMSPNEAAVLVPVHINGEGPFELVLDTGATYTCVATSLAERLQLRDQPGAVGIGAGVQAAGRVRIVRLDSVRVGNTIAHDLPGCVLDLDALRTIGASADGLLGLNFLRGFDVRLDFRRRVIGFTAPADD